MSSAQLHLAETIDTFYGASDKTSDSAMAAHAYRRSVEELDAGIGRELVRVLPLSLPFTSPGGYNITSAFRDRD